MIGSVVRAVKSHSSGKKPNFDPKPQKSRNDSSYQLELEEGLDTKANFIIQDDKTKLNTGIDLVVKDKLVPAISIELPFNLGKKSRSFPIVIDEYRINLCNAELIY